MSELVFDVTQESDGGFVAEALGESIITEGNTWDELRHNVREAVTAFYFDQHWRATDDAAQCVDAERRSWD